LANKLSTPVELFTGDYNQENSITAQAVWDTGAMISVINSSQRQN
jgi:hypothetical protein